MDSRLNACVQVFKCESFAYNSSTDVLQAEQMADAQLKKVVQDWEGMMETFKVAVEERVADELNPMVYPQVRQDHGQPQVSLDGYRRWSLVRALSSCRTTVLWRIPHCGRRCTPEFQNLQCVGNSLAVFYPSPLPWVRVEVVRSLQGIRLAAISCWFES